MERDARRLRSISCHVTPAAAGPAAGGKKKKLALVATTVRMDEGGTLSQCVHMHSYTLSLRFCTLYMYGILMRMAANDVVQNTHMHGL
jgi:hypothetical protein